MGTPSQQKALLDLYSIRPKDTSIKIASIKEIFQETGAAKSTQNAIATYTEEAFEVLEKLKASNDKKKMLKTFGENLMHRKV